jgi:uncharacterized RDD family membrane protein YckC
MNEKWISKMLHEKYHAGLFHRLISFIYDIVVIVFVWFVSGIITSFWMLKQSDAPSINLQDIHSYIWENEFHLYLISWVVQIFFVLLFHYVIPMFKRQTIGMSMVGLYLQNKEAKKVSKRQYIKRECLKLFLFPTLFVNPKRPLYDRLTKTYLLK